MNMKLRKNNCPVCGHTKLVHKYEIDNRQLLMRGSIVDGKKHNLFACLRCSAHFLYPAPTQKELKKIYNSHYKKSGANQSMQSGGGFSLIESLKSRSSAINTPVMELRISKILKYSLPEYVIAIERVLGQNKIKILDMGCGEGLLLSNVIELFDIEDHLGIDFSKEAVEICTSKGLKAKSIDLKSVNRKFNLVTANHVLEHIPNPVEFMKNISKVLEDDGYIVFSLPNTDGLSRRIFGKYWQGYSIPKHLINYNVKSLTHLLDLTSFELVDYSTRNIHLHSILLAMNRISLGGIEKLFNFASILPSKMFGKMGDEITIVARKKK